MPGQPDGSEAAGASCRSWRSWMYRKLLLLDQRGGKPALSALLSDDQSCASLRWSATDPSRRRSGRRLRLPTWWSGVGPLPRGRPAPISSGRMGSKGLQVSRYQSHSCTLRTAARLELGTSDAFPSECASVPQTSHVDAFLSVRHTYPVPYPANGTCVHLSCWLSPMHGGPARVCCSRCVSIQQSPGGLRREAEILQSM